MKVSVLGCGRWGSFIGWYLSSKGHEVCQWGRESSLAYKTLYINGKNDYISLNKNIKLTSDVSYAVDFSDVLIISISSQALRSFILGLKDFDLSNKKFVLCMKGVEVETGKRLSEVLIDCGINKENIAVWVGPGHIQEFTKGKPNCMLIDSYNLELSEYLVENFKSDLIRFYYGDDIIGTEIGAATKNIMGIAAGLLDGGGYTTLKGALMARGAREVGRLIKAMGGNELSAYGLCHLGDYETTLFSEYSHNRSFGIKFVRGEKFDKLAEGVSTAKAIKQLGEKYNVELPITNAVYDIIYQNKKPKEVFDKLFSRSARKEF